MFISVMLVSLYLSLSSDNTRTSWRTWRRMRLWGRTLTSTEVSSWTPPSCHCTSIQRHISPSLEDCCQCCSLNSVTLGYYRWLLHFYFLFFYFRCIKDPSGERHRRWRSTTYLADGDAGGAQPIRCNRRRGCRHDDGLAGRHLACVTLTADLSNTGPLLIQWHSYTQGWTDSRLRTDWLNDTSCFILQSSTAHQMLMQWLIAVKTHKLCYNGAT